MKPNVKTIYKTSNVAITKKYLVKVGLLFMMIMSSHCTFGQGFPPSVDFIKNSKKAAVIVSNYDGSDDEREYIYLRSGEDDNWEWLNGAQFIVADNWVATRKPFRFYTTRNSWNGSGEYIMNRKHVGSNRAYGLTFFAGGKESMTLCRGRKGDPSLYLGGTSNEGWSRIGANGSIAFWTNGKSNADDSPQLLLENDGNLYVGINSSSVNSSLKERFDLFVKKGILAEDFVLGASKYWADYVFDKDYKLRPLSEVAQFIKKNKHLPNIPSKGVISKEGHSMHNMNVLFLEKIEELTLYTIQNKKRIKKLSDRLDSLTE